MTAVCRGSDPPIAVAQSYLDAGKNEKAEAAFRRVLEDNPDSIEARLGLAEAIFRLYRHDEAEKILKDVLEKNPEIGRAHV